MTFPREKHWPPIADLKLYFLAPPGKERLLDESGSGSLSLEGVDGTEHLALGEGRIDIRLSMWADKKHGVMLIWIKRGGGHQEAYTSKGDMKRLREYVTTRHGDKMPIGLYIPFKEAWIAVKDFIESEGGRSKRIEWVENNTLPKDTFPEPAPPV